MYEQSFYSGRMHEIELEQAVREAERVRMLRERLGEPARRVGVIERIRVAAMRRRGASPVSRDAVPCASGPAQA